MYCGHPFIRCFLTPVEREIIQPYKSKKQGEKIGHAIIMDLVLNVGNIYGDIFLSIELSYTNNDWNQDKKEDMRLCNYFFHE